MTKTLPRPTWLRHRDVSPHQADELPADGQAEARAGPRLLPGLGLLEMTEQLVLLVLRDARAGVLDLDRRHGRGRGLAVRVHAQADAPLLGELDGVAQDVDEDLTQFVDVGVTMKRGTSPIVSTENDSFFSFVRTRNIISRSLSRTGRSNVEGFRVVRPASILDISRTSLIRARRCSPLRLMVPRYWTLLAG